MRSDDEPPVVTDETPADGTRISDPTKARVSSHTSEHAVSDAASYAQARMAGGTSSEGGGLYRLLVESVQDYAIFALDTTGHIVSWNAGAERFKGYAAAEIIGQHFSVFYPPEDVAARKPELELEAAIRDGRLEDEGWRVRKDGSRFWGNVVITTLRDASGAHVGFAKVTRDLTERRAAEAKALDDARQVASAQHANEAKAAFLAAMSHELRTPLNAIAGYADLLLTGIGGDITSQQEQYLARIRGSQQHLLAIINDILNFSRIEAGQLEYEIRTVSLQTVVDAVLPMIEPQATAKSLAITQSAFRDASVRGDQSKIEQILLNLLSNAVKFTPSGGSIELTCAQRGARIELAICDTGIGIPADAIGAIFQPFIQLGRTLTSTQEGTGLGLAISSDLAKAMGGELAVRSTLGEGSTFTLTLPAASQD